MKNFAPLFFILTILISAFSSCKKDKDAGPYMGYSYFPIDVGSYIVYDVDSFYYDDFNKKIDTFKFQLKEKIESIYADNQNRPTVRLERYKKTYNATVPYSSMQWTLVNVWAENRTATTAEKVEENLRYVKLKFPVNNDQKWDGNAQNVLEKWNYKYAFLNLSRTIGNIYFDSVLQVTQFDDQLSNLVERKYYVEKYATGVGLIFKQVIDVESQPGSNPPPNFLSIPIMQRVTSGFQYTMTVNSYGVE